MVHAQVLPHHLTRKAVIYIRQSTGHQVLTNQESQKMQLAMKEHAVRLGFPENLIEIVEIDTGTSAQSTAGRRGYKNLLSELALGEIGVILSYESTRLSRNCSDWYPLLDLCALHHCLIADRDGVYDPSTPNDRLFLGMKGMISEIELHTLRGRLNAGIENKARRGELCVPLPAGFVRLENDTVVKDPDLQVQELIALVFKTFLEQRSACKVANYFRHHGLLLPRQPLYEERTVFRPTSVPAIAAILRNPAYAGAFVYGRTKTTCSSDPQRAGWVTKRCPRDKWRVLLQDRWPGYIDWDTFERIQAMLSDNHADYKKKRSRGIPRDGQALLAGLVYCGLCGHKMSVRYPREIRYECDFQHVNSSHDKRCQSLVAAPIDRYVQESFFSALTPVELDLYEEAQRRVMAQSDEVWSAQERHLQRLRYEVNLARRQYDRTDPDHRLVAFELERRWEAALSELQQAEQRYAKDQQQLKAQAARRIPVELRTAFSSVGQALPGLWPKMNGAARKSLLRCLVDKVVLTRLPERERLQVRIVWRGGAYSETELVIGVNRLQDLSNYQALQARILALAAEGKPDAEIATLLTAEGFHSAQRTYLTEHAVTLMRQKALGSTGAHRPVGGKLSVSRAAALVGVSSSWLYSRIRRGVITMPRDDEYGIYLFSNDPETLTQLCRLRDGLIHNLELKGGHQHE
jgi:DNA invertase Pin-like site-specific DNA recombinase